MIAALTAEELTKILGAYTALVVGMGGLMLKVLVAINRKADAVNKAVNNRPSDQPDLYDRVDRLATSFDEYRESQKLQHAENRGRLLMVKDSVDALTGRVENLERKP